MKTEEIMELINMARKASENAISPFSGFRVGASVLSNTLKIYTGFNIENPSLMMSICAEKVAIINAISSGERSIKAIAVFSSERDYCFPCGSCRQFMYEFSPEVQIYLAGREGIKKYTIKELLPHAFSTSPNGKNL